MRLSQHFFIVAAFCFFSNNTVFSQDVESAAEEGKGAETKEEPATVKSLDEAQLKDLLDSRIRGGMQHTFGAFANMFFVSSRIELGIGIGLSTSVKGAAEMPLQSPFPPSYKPTLREFLDAIALQTSTKWEYDPKPKIGGDGGGAELDDIAIFNFTKMEGREKPFEVDLVEGWKALDKGNWVMHVPPTFPVGMDIYEMGTYSPMEGDADAEFANRIRQQVALSWATRVNPEATAKDFKPAKVGEIDALYFESMVGSRVGKEIRWRQWVFMDQNRCFFIVSTILPELDDKIFPDVQKMIASFRLKEE